MFQDTSRSKPDDLAHRRYPHVCTRCPESPWQQSYSGLTVYPRAIRRDFLHIYIYITSQTAFKYSTLPNRPFGRPSAGTTTDVDVYTSRSIYIYIYILTFKPAVGIYAKYIY